MVFCDMDYAGGGWTLVGRGIGGRGVSWKARFVYMLVHFPAGKQQFCSPLPYYAHSLTLIVVAASTPRTTGPSELLAHFRRVQP